MSKSPACHVHFVLASNNLSSISRITAEYANELAKAGWKVTISYPLINNIDYRLWRVWRDLNNRGSGIISILKAAFQLLRIFVMAPLKELALDRRGSLEWKGKAFYGLDPAVTCNRFPVWPTQWNMADADFIVLLQEYLLPHIIKLPASKGAVIGSVHTDYQIAVNDKDEITREWWQVMVNISRRARAPFLATARRAARSAESLGIPIAGIIPNGVRLDKFRDGGRRGASHPVVVTLFCAGHSAKGLEYGLEVVKALRKEFSPPEAIFRSLSRIPESAKQYFDVNPGFLSESEYQEAYRTTDILIYPSLYDGFPAPPLEAMASGCALATTRVSGLEDYAEDGANCLMVEPGNVEQMVNNVRRLITDVTLRDTIRSGGLKTAARYSVPECATMLMEFIAKVRGQ